MDIKHVVNATAVITLGKDMIFRDYVQGAYRMRGIGMSLSIVLLLVRSKSLNYCGRVGIGQKIHVFVIPEVRQLIQREVQVSKPSRHRTLSANSVKAAVIDDVTSAVPFSTEGALALSRAPSLQKAASHGAASVGDSMLEDIVAWLIINSLRSEQTQWTMLCLQNVANLYRKNAFKALLKGVEEFTVPTAPSEGASVAKLIESAAEDSKAPEGAAAESKFDGAMKIFTEPLAFDLESGVPDPVPFEEKLKAMLNENESFLEPEQHKIGHR
jgi:hypothetical protein